MAITAAGIGSGLDIAGLVNNLVAAERAPQQNLLDGKESKVRSQISAIGTLKGALSNFATSLNALKSDGAFAKRTSASSDTAVITATADGTSVPGRYSIEVTETASAHKLASAGFTSSSTTVGTGTLTLAANGKTFNLTIDNSNKSLAGIRDAINNASANTFVDAAIVTADDGAHLVLTARASGADNALRVTQSGGDGNLSQLVYDPGTSTVLTEKSVARDAAFVVDGFSYTSDSNTVTDAIAGVTLQIVAKDVGKTKTLTIGRDTDAVKKAIDGFITGYNIVVASINTTTRYDAATKTASALTGDALPRQIQSDLRGALTATRATGTVRALTEIGIKTNADGTLTIDKTKLDSKLASDFQGVQELFTGTGGFATGFVSTVEKITKTDGRIDTRSDSLDAQLRTIDQQRTAFERRMSDVAQRYQTQFTALDSLVAKMRSTGDFLTRQLASL